MHLLFLFELFVIAYIALILGSFATAVTYREARNLAWFNLWGKENDLWSKCPSCEHKLGVRDLVPIFSWFLSKGKCRHCGESISIRYPLIESVCLLACLGIYVSWGFTAETFFLIALIPFLIALFIIDLEQMILPNRLISICLAIAVVFSLWNFIGIRMEPILWLRFQDVVAGLVVFPALFWLVGKVMSLILNRNSIGSGDIKFLVPCGLLVGFSYLPVFLILSGVLGVITAIGLRILRFKLPYSPAFPFGPSLILGLYFVLIFQGFDIKGF